MLGKNTAVFGIYPTYESLEGAVDALRSSGFRNTDVSFLMARTWVPKIWGTEREQRDPRASWLERVPESFSAELWVGSSE